MSYVPWLVVILSFCFATVNHFMLFNYFSLNVMIFFLSVGERQFVFALTGNVTFWPLKSEILFLIKLLPHPPSHPPFCKFNWILVHLHLRCWPEVFIFSHSLVAIQVLLTLFNIIRSIWFWNPFSTDIESVKNCIS